MSLPPYVSYGTVTGRFLVADTDGVDIDSTPESFPASGSVFFTASAGYFLNYEAEDGAYATVRAPIVGILDTDGYLIDPTTGERGLSLPATDNPEFTPLNWTWEVVYDLRDHNGKPVRVFPIQHIAVPTDGVVDLVKALPIPKSTGVFESKGPVGDRGAQGPQGPAGIPGPAGSQGPVGPVGPAGASGLTGPQGPTGATGVQGPAGTQGPKGDTGATGAQGIQGPQGVKGDTGLTGATGPAGAQGIQGVKGDTGSQGPVGPAGMEWRGNWSASVDYVNDDAVYYDGGSWFAAGNPTLGEVPSEASAHWNPLAIRGLQGPAGATGSQGTAGPTGPQGPQGPAGPQGVKGDTGSAGPAGADSTVAGPTGPAGAQGPQGPQGIQGPTGATGSQGLKGDKGDKGDTPDAYVAPSIELAPAEDIPTVTYAPLEIWGQAPSIAGSAGWYREKRIGAAETPPNVGGQWDSGALDLTGSSYFRYPSVPGALDYGPNTARIVITDLKPGGDSQYAYWLFNVEFVTSSPVVEFALNASTTNGNFGMVLVDGKRVSDRTLVHNGVAGGMSAKLTFPSARPRTITVYGLNNGNGRFGGVAVAAGYTVVKPVPRPARRIAIIGDSYVNGTDDVAVTDTFAWRLARLMGADEILQAGIGGTGFVATIGGASNSTFAGRISAVLAMNPDVVIFAGGRNDSTSGLQAAVTAAVTSVAGKEVYVVSTASDALQQPVNDALKAGAAAANVPFIRANVDAIPKIDGIHPTFEGHKDFADAVYSKMVVQTVAGPTGPQGATGATGAQGPQGIQGVKGDTGSQGIQGIQGATGATGPSGVAIVNHGSDATVARPSATVVFWYGSVAPNNWTTTDIWVSV